MKRVSTVGIQMKQKWLSYISKLATLKEHIISRQTHFPNTATRQNSYRDNKHQEANFTEVNIQIQVLRNFYEFQTFIIFSSRISYVQ